MRLMRYLALGDSYTIGESVPLEECWSYQLAGLLEAEGISLEVMVIARTGWTVRELWEGIQSNPPEGSYDLVTLLIGVNDQYRGYPLEGYRQDFRSMLAKAIRYAAADAKKVIVLSIPDWGVTPFAAGRDPKQIARQIDEFNIVNHEETQAAGAHYVDVTPSSRLAPGDLDMLARDGLHPSGKMYRLWAEKVAPVVKGILRSEGETHE